MPERTLARRERQIMDMVYAAGPEGATAVLIHQALPDPPSYSAVRALLAVLENKGHLRHTRHGKQYVYFATTPRTQAAKSAFRRVLDTFFAGSLEQAVAAHLTDPKTRLSQGQVKRLTALIKQAHTRGD